jgi:hypothetical protein
MSTNVAIHLIRQSLSGGWGSRGWEVFSVADPDPGFGAFLTPGSGMGRKSASGSGMNNPDHVFQSLETILFLFFGVKILKFFDADPGSGMETVRIRDPGWKKVGSGINIPDPQHWKYYF